MEPEGGCEVETLPKAEHCTSSRQASITQTLRKTVSEVTSIADLCNQFRTRYNPERVSEFCLPIGTSIPSPGGRFPYLNIANDAGGDAEAFQDLPVMSALSIAGIV